MLADVVAAGPPVPGLLEEQVGETATAAVKDAPSVGPRRWPLTATGDAPTKAAAKTAAASVLLAALEGGST
jgi:hypothetical protein